MGEICSKSEFALAAQTIYVGNESLVTICLTDGLYMIHIFPADGQIFLNA